MQAITVSYNERKPFHIHAYLALRAKKQALQRSKEEKFYAFLSFL